jgi:hypothetical protein
MAVFTAIATAVVSAIGITGLAATIATAVVATGLAVGTAKVLGVFTPPKQDQKDPGVKIQLAPSTDNKVPRMYGRNYTGSLIIDAEIKNKNNTMAYCMTISEFNINSGETWSINKIYRGDAELVFGSGTTAHIVQRVIDPNTTTNTSVTGKLRCRVYAGGSNASNQIFPVTNQVPAYGTGSCQMSTWTTANTMRGLVFAIFEMDYDSENGLTALDNITFDIQNSLNRPANVLIDYLTNARYGAGLSNVDLDLTSFNALHSYADANVSYITAGGANATHRRYQIDGAVSTFQPIKQNINKICQASGAFFTYNSKVGKFGVVTNRAATVGEKANAFVLNDNNIIGGINISSTELYSLYNQIEVEYPSVNQRDQTDVYFAEIDPSIRNSNEPDNPLSYRLDMVNDRARVAQLANIDLNQSRLSMVVDLTADFSALQIDVGDVVKLTVPLYGFNDKLFRCMRTVEEEDADGVLTVRIMLLEYDDDIYGDLITQEDLPPAVTGITNWWAINSNAVLTLGNITVVNDPLSANAQQYNATTGTFIGNISMASVRSTFGSAFKNTAFLNIPIKPPVNTKFNLAKVSVVDIATETPAYYAATPSRLVFSDDEFFDLAVSTADFNKDEPFYIEVQMQNTETGATSRKFVTGNLNVIPENTVVLDDVAPDAAGSQVLRAGVANSSIVSGTTYLPITPPADIVTTDISRADPGVYALDTSVTPSGTFGVTPYDIAMRSNAAVWFSNSTSNVRVIFDGGGGFFTNLNQSPPQIFDNQEIILDPVILADMFPGSIAPNQFAANITIRLEGYSTMGSSNAAPRGFGDQKWNLFKIAKNQYEQEP